MASSASSEQLFLEFSVKKLRQLLSRIHVSLDLLSEEQIWLRPGENSNSIANLCLHLTGNLHDWILHGIDGQPDTRRRDEEFSARGGYTKQQLFSRLSDVVQKSCAIIGELTPERLAETIHPQKYDVSVLEAVYHVVEHFAGHTGQILYFTKSLTGRDLGFYRHLSAAIEAPPPPAGQETP